MTKPGTYRKDAVVQTAYALTSQTVGRPTNYSPDYPALVLQMIEEIPGITIAEVARNLRTHKWTLFDWADAHPEFNHSVKCIKTWGEAHFAERVRLAKKLDIHGMFFLKAAHGWRDQGDADTKGKGPSTVLIKIEVVNGLLSGPPVVVPAAEKEREQREVIDITPEP